MIKLVASDLDGTLLLHKAQSLPEEIFSLIRQLEELGIMFVAASGRQYPNMTKLFAPVASEISYISENGALAVDHGEVLYQDSFDRKLAGEIISAILEKKDAEFTCSAKDYHYLMPKTKRFHDHMLYEVKNECRFVNSMEEMTAPIMKLAVFEPAGLTEESVKYWMDRFGKDVSMVRLDEEHFVTNVEVSVSRQFLAWVIGLGEGVTILGPQSVVDMMKEEIKRLTNQYE